MIQSRIMTRAVLGALLLVAWPTWAAPGEAEAPSDDITVQWELLTPEKLQQLLAEAAAARLAMEREVVAAEVDSILYEPKDRKAAMEILRAGPAEMQQDNIELICRALARANPEFGNAYALMSEGKHPEAAGAAKALLDPRETSYLSAACHYLHAEALFAQGRYAEAVEAFEPILRTMPDRTSFAAAAAVRSAQGYEKSNRLYYAMQMYGHSIQKYGLTLSRADLDESLERYASLAEIFEDPMRAVADRMEQVERRLDAIDSGPETRRTQQHIVAILEDLIQTLEEQQSSSQDQQQRQKSPKQCSQCGGKGCSQCQGQAQGQAGVVGQGSGLPQPVNPAERSWLPLGAVARPPALSEARPPDEQLNWSSLPPAARQKLEEALRHSLPRNYRLLINEYRKQLSQGQEQNP